VTVSVAYETNWGTDLTLATDIDLTGDQFKFVTLGSDGYIDIASTGQLAIGVVQDSPVGTVGTPVAVPVRTMAPTKIQAGGSFNPGDKLASDSAGKAVLYTGATVYTGTPYTVSGSQVLGIALSFGNSGQDTTMLFRPSGLSA
jgi:hypothetical protein